LQMYQKLFAKTPLLVILIRIVGLRGASPRREQYLLQGKDAAMAEKDTDVQKIKELIEIMKENELLEVEIKHGDDKIFLKRSQPQPSVGGAVSAIPTMRPEPGATPAHAGGTEALIQTYVSQPPPAPENLVEIKSPIVGTFYATSSPKSEHYVEVGSTVSPQTVVCIIEAMKVMNEIKAETSGTIAEILVTNGQAVEYGQVLFKVKPD
jgi:acetyl-CoA carboxylase biotin carboxyl carrier protein